MVKLTTYNFLIFSLFLSVVIKTSESYSISERIKIVELYYANKCSASLTQKAYRKHFNVGTAPSSSTIRNMVKRFEERGSVKDLRRSGRSRTGTSDENALLVRESLNENNQLSVRRRAKELCIPRTTLARIINQELYLFPYKMQVAQRIEATDNAK
uniref:DUF4817 domain-containing protein n=1 Tax=Strongyloides papillosus TaxID=174720 RepID=A0A0N5C0I3_STREA